MVKRLVFQVGKRIDGEQFVATIYEDVHMKSLECALFDLNGGRV
jgi:hypothetical protein